MQFDVSEYLTGLFPSAEMPTPVHEPVASASLVPTVVMHSGRELWDQPEALRLMGVADGWVGSLGVSGRDPDVQRVAAVVASEYETRDMGAFRFAIGEFERVVRATSKRQSDLSDARG